MKTAKIDLREELVALSERTGLAPAEIAAAAADLEDELEAERIAAAEHAYERVKAGAPTRTLDEVEPELKARLEERIAARQQ
jgi:hypothetical protein